MFRTHNLAAVSLLLATLIAHPSAQAEGLTLPEKDVNPTGGMIHAAYYGSIPTCMVCNATSMSSNTTCSAFCSTYGHCTPTVFPQETMLSASSGKQLASPGHDYTTQSPLMQEQMMLNLLNRDRKINGLPALTHDEELSRIARVKSADMRDNGYFAHESPTYGNVRAMLKHFGYPYAGAGENIAHHANADKAQAAFMSSPGHRANILSKAWTKVGVGIVYDRQGYIYATQIFAR